MASKTVLSKQQVERVERSLQNTAKWCMIFVTLSLVCGACLWVISYYTKNCSRGAGGGEANRGEKEYFL